MVAWPLMNTGHSWRENSQYHTINREVTSAFQPLAARALPALNNPPNSSCMHRIMYDMIRLQGTRQEF